MNGRRARGGDNVSKIAFNDHWPSPKLMKNTDILTNRGGPGLQEGDSIKKPFHILDHYWW